MPTTVLRLRVLLASAGLAAVPLLALATPFPAGTAESAAAAPLSTPTPCETFPFNTCPRPTATPQPTEDPTQSPAPQATATATPGPTRTHPPTRSPRPQATFTVPGGSTASPVTATIGVGAVSPGSTDTTPQTEPVSSHTSGASSKLTRLIELVLGGAVLLGLGGAVGLYVTRHRHDH